METSIKHSFCWTQNIDLISMELIHSFYLHESEDLNYFLFFSLLSISLIFISVFSNLLFPELVPGFSFIVTY